MFTVGVPFDCAFLMLSFWKGEFHFAVFQRRHNDILLKPLNSLVLADFEDEENSR